MLNTNVDERIRSYPVAVPTSSHWRIRESTQCSPHAVITRTLRTLPTMQQQPRNGQQQPPADVEDHHDRDVAAGDADAEVADATVVKEQEMSLQAASLTDPAAAPAQCRSPRALALQPILLGDVAPIDFNRAHPASAEEFEAVAVLAAWSSRRMKQAVHCRPFGP
jgi:hypothetical protein